MSTDTTHRPANRTGSPKTDISTLIGEINAGVLEQQINRALSDIAANVCTHKKKGELNLRLKISRIGESTQVMVTTELRSVVPMQRGRMIEETEGETPLHVGRGGALALFPHDQMDLLPPR